MPGAAYNQALERLNDIVADLDRALPQQAGAVDRANAARAALQHDAGDYFGNMVAKAKEYILAGDIFQVVLSQRFSLPFKLPPFALYRSLRRAQPLALPVLPGSRRLHHHRLQPGNPGAVARRARSRSARSPAPARAARRRRKTSAYAADLLADPKELSEHLMLLDLGRNDVGRVAEIGSVKVTEKFHHRKL